MDAAQWESERSTLLELLAHTQSMLKAAQEAAPRDRDELSEQYRLMELRLTSQIKLLRSENASLKQELERINSVQGLDGVSLKSFMLKEIDKVERRAHERETELLGLVESSQHETQVHKSQLESKARAFGLERERLSKELDAVKQEVKSAHMRYNPQIQALKTENEKSQGDLRKAFEDLKAARAEYHSLQEAEASKKAQLADACAKEKEGLNIEVEKLKKILRRKDKMIAGISSATDSEKRAEFTPLRAQIEALGTDKQALKQQLQLAAALYAKKEKNLLEQVDTWKKAAEQMKVRPASVQSIPEAEQQRLSALISALESNDRLLRERVSDMESHSASLKSVLEQRQQEETESSMEKERRLDKLLRDFAAHREYPQLEKMETKLTQVANAYETAIQEICEKAGSTLERTSEAMQEQIRGMAAQHQDLVSLTVENQRLTAQLEELQATNKAGLELKTAEELLKTRLELEESKKTMTAYLESIQSLEVLIEDHTEEGEIKGDIEMEFERFNAEVTRIAHENAILTEGKKKLEEEFTAGIAKLREALDAKTKENSVLKAKLTQEKKNSVELIRAISDKIEEAVSTVADANASIRAELKQFLRSLPEVSRLQQAWTDAQAEILNSLKQESQDKDTLILSLRQSWQDEVSSLRAESNDQHLGSLSAVSALFDSQVKSVSSLRVSLASALDSVSQIAEQLTTTFGGRSRDPKTQRLETEVESLKALLSSKQQEFQEELTMIRSQAESEVKSVRQIQTTLTAEITTLRGKLKEVKALSQ